MVLSASGKPPVSTELADGLRVVDPDAVLGLDLLHQAREHGQRTLRPLRPGRVVEGDVGVDALQPQPRLREHLAHQRRRVAGPHAEPPETAVDLHVHVDRPSRPAAGGRQRRHALRRVDGRRQPVLEQHAEALGQLRSVHQDRQRRAGVAQGQRVVEVRRRQPVHPERARGGARPDDAVAVGARLHGSQHLHRAAGALAQPLEVVRDRAEIDLAPDGPGVGVARLGAVVVVTDRRRRGSRPAARSGPAGRCRRRRCRASGGSARSPCWTSRCTSA